MTDRLFLHDLGVFDHGDASTLGHFPLQSDCFAAELSQLIVHWLMFADDQIRFAVADDANRTATLDAFRAARLSMLLANGVVVHVAHHVDHFTGNFFRSGCVTAILVFLCDSQWRDSECTDERHSHCSLH